MIDIHCHILPGIDDGAPTEAAALEMLKCAASDGIDTLFCTPHFSNDATEKMDQIREKLQEKADALGIKLLSGMEYQYSHLTMAKNNLRSLAESTYLLIDLGTPTLPPLIAEAFFNLERLGYQIIVAHPERYLKDMDSCAELFRLGASFQLNADSILGKNGPFCYKMAKRMIEKGYCHYIASDAHNDQRTFRLTECREFLTKRYKKEFTELVMDDNPRRLLSQLPPQNPPVKSQGWFSKIFNRD